jgi:hypothetical protein
MGLADSILKLLTTIAGLITRFFSKKDAEQGSFARWLSWSGEEGGKSSRMNEADRDMTDELSKRRDEREAKLNNLH